MWFLVVLVFIFSTLFPTQSFAHSASVIIKMTPNGFEPQTATVDENSIVIFTNEDKLDRWPASNIHPTHDLYPEFDPKKPIPAGQPWLFKTKKAGQWKYHDHLYPHMRGTLIVQKENGVTEDESKKENILVKIFLGIKKWVSGLTGKFSTSSVKPEKIIAASEFIKLSANEQIKALQGMAKLKDAVSAWQYIQETFKGQSGSSGNIHDLAHLTGGLIYESLDFKGLSKCSPEFAFGCYHGFLDKAFQKNLDKLNEAENSCRTLGEGGPSASCIHGIGHGVASFYQTADLKGALSSCKRLSTQGLQYCFDGVFMEFERSTPQTFYKSSNPYYPCDEVEREFGSEVSFACGRNQPTVLMSKFKFSFEDVIGVCLSSRSAQFKTACFDALGFITVKSTSNPPEVMAACQKIAVPEYILRCVKAAAGELIFQGVPGWQTKSPQICRLLPIELHGDCQNYINQLIRQYGRKISSEFRTKENGEDPNDYIRKQLKLCYETSGKDDCYKVVASIFFDQFGLKKTLELLQQNENYPEVYARCHEVTHYLSRSEYDRLGSIAGVYAQCNSTCHGGCYHGTLEAYLKSKGLDENNLKKEFALVCGVKEDHATPLVFNECLHGLGHAAMFVLDMRLPASLQLCDALSDQVFKERCYTGVFMENSSSSTSFDHKSLYIKEDDPFYPCNSLPEKYQSLCWQYQSSYFSIISNQDWVKVANMCLQIPAQYQERCIRTIGTNQVGFTQSLEKMRDDCYLMPTDHFKDVCISGVVSSLSYRFVGDSSKTIEFCSLVDGPYQEGCFKQMGEGVLDWDSNKDLAKKNCQAIPNPQQAAWCLSVI